MRKSHGTGGGGENEGVAKKGHLKVPAEAYYQSNDGQRVERYISNKAKELHQIKIGRWKGFFKVDFL